MQRACRCLHGCTSLVGFSKSCITCEINGLGQEREDPLHDAQKTFQRYRWPNAIYLLPKVEWCRSEISCHVILKTVCRSETESEKVESSLECKMIAFSPGGWTSSRYSVCPFGTLPVSSKQVMSTMKLLKK